MFKIHVMLLRKFEHFVGDDRTLDFIFADKEVFVFVRFFFWRLLLAAYVIMFRLEFWLVCLNGARNKIQGDKIHASLKDCVPNDPLSELNEGEWLILKNFKLESVEGNFRPASHDYKIILSSKTSVKFYRAVVHLSILHSLIFVIFMVDYVILTIAWVSLHSGDLCCVSSLVLNWFG